MEYQIKNKISMPRYQQIAVEIATRIANEEYKVGDKIYTRSYIAGHYGVSPETARRAICVLSDLDIVVSEKGSGVTIKSRQMEALNQYLSELIQASEHFRSMNPFMPFEIHITKDCHYLNRNLSDIQFWQNTGATVIAVRKQDELLRSPGPYIELCEHDILYFLPQDDSTQRVTEFLYPPKEE